MTRQADILIAAMGQMGSITADMVRDGAVVIDVGTNPVPDATNACVSVEPLVDAPTKTTSLPAWARIGTVKRAVARAQCGSRGMETPGKDGWRGGGIADTPTMHEASPP